MNSVVLKRFGVLLLVIVFGLVMTGCASTHVYGNVSMINPEPEPDNPLLFEDDLISAQFEPILNINRSTGRLESIMVNLTNLSEDAPIRIIWDDAAYVNVHGSSSGLLHGEATFADIGDRIPSTTIPANSRSEIILVPEETVYYDEDEGWTRDPYYEIEPGDIDTFDGSTVRVLLPIEIEGEKYEYDFEFEANYSTGEVGFFEGLF